MSKRLAVTLGIAVGLALAGPAAAAPSWQRAVMLDTVRGAADPEVGISSSGMATVVFSDAPVGAVPGVYAVRRQPANAFGAPQLVGFGVEPDVAVAPDGTTAIVWQDENRVAALTAMPGQAPRAGSVRQLLVPGATAANPRVGIDGGGRVTVVWRSPGHGSDGSLTQLRTAALERDGSVTGPEDLGPLGPCPGHGLDLQVNLAGDAVVTCEGRNEVYVRAPGGGFETVAFEPPEPGLDYVTLDGAGTVTAVTTHDDPKRLQATTYRIRPRGGTFGPQRTLDAGGGRLATFTLVSQERRSVAVWSEGGWLRYAVRPTGGEFGGAARVGVRAGRWLLGHPAAPLGPLPLLTAGLTADRAATGAVLAFEVADDYVRGLAAPEIPGTRDFPMAVAGAENGLAVAAWEQRCRGEGFAVMAMALDETSGFTPRPCQDRAAPKVVVRPQRARLTGRRLRLRAACDERCTVVMRIRVLRQGRGRPLARSKLAARRLDARRFRSFEARLRPVDAAHVRGALAAGRRVVVRLALSVGDRWGNGAVRRVAVPLRR